MFALSVAEKTVRMRMKVPMISALKVEAFE